MTISWVVFLGWCAVINYGILALWLIMVTLARELSCRSHCRLFNITETQFYAFHYGGIGLYKLLIVFFNFIPYLVLRLVQ